MSLAVLVALTIGAGCASWSYRGDGKLTDRGPLAIRSRYLLDLGPVDLSRKAEYSYRLIGLPEEDMAVGISILELSTTERNRPRPNHPVHVHLTLETADHQLVIREDGTLNSWLWGETTLEAESSYFRVGETRYVSIGPGVTRPERIGEKYDHGWGTFFKPKHDTAYILTLEILDGDPAPQSPANLLLKGGIGLDLP